MKIALVHEWLTVIGGSENVFKEIALLYPDADIFTLVSIDRTVKELGLDKHKITTSFIQKLPFAQTKYRNYLPFFTYAIEQFDLSAYDLVISSSHAVAKGVLTNSDQIHVCYCHSPIRYAWDLYHQYLDRSGLKKGLKGFLVKYTLHKIRQWDVNSSNRVDHFISNSNYIGRRIKKIYGRQSITIYPNVAVDDLVPQLPREDFYFTCSRFVPYKKIDIIIQAFASMPDKKLYVIGDGPELKKIKKIAPSNVTLLGYQPFNVLKDHLERTKAFVFAAEEDFGIIPVEAQAAGAPVIAYGKGGCTETIINNKTGVFFYEQSPKAIIDAIAFFEQNIHTFDSVEISKHASAFSVQRFRNQFSAYLNDIAANLMTR